MRVAMVTAPGDATVVDVPVPTVGPSDVLVKMRLEVAPEHIPFDVAALSEPVAVVRHGVNRCAPKPRQGRRVRRRPDRTLSSKSPKT